MGGQVLELESERLRREGKAEGIAEGKAEGISLGMADGEMRMAVLINRLILDKRSDEIQAAVTDEKVRHRLFEEYGL